MTSIRNVLAIVICIIALLSNYLQAQGSRTAPTIDFIDDPGVAVTASIRFKVYARSTHGDVPWLWAESLPQGANLVDSRGVTELLCGRQVFIKGGVNITSD